uniref:C-type lectin domain-containing protein n=1 Tax=Cyclopterus lumpus TaxID=8103 RepID=A0A8C2WAX4_CYCLU
MPAASNRTLHPSFHDHLNPSLDLFPLPKSNPLFHLPTNHLKPISLLAWSLLLKTMSEAQRHCRENYKDLVTIRDLEDLETLKTLVDLSRMRAWIGLYDDSWRWSLSNTSFYKPGEAEFRQWRSGEPSNYFREHCTYIYQDGRWHDSRCEHDMKSVCFDVRVTSFKNRLKTFLFNSPYS